MTIGVRTRRRKVFYKNYVFVIKKMNFKYHYLGRILMLNFEKSFFLRFLIVTNAPLIQIILYDQSYETTRKSFLKDYKQILFTINQINILQFVQHFNLVSWELLKGRSSIGF